MTTQKHLPTVLLTLLSLVIAGCLDPNQTNAEDQNTYPLHEPEPYPEPEPEPEPEYEPWCDNETETNSMQFDISSDVPDKDLTMIRCGFAIGEDFLDRKLEGGLPDAVLAEVAVKIVATGEGNPNNGGVCCSVDSRGNGYIGIFFDVNHAHWQNPWEGWPANPQREAGVIHEYAHAWQGSRDCLEGLGGSLWVEGMATQISFASMIERKHFDKDDVLAFMQSAAKSGNGEQWNTPLRDLEANAEGVWPGHIGYLALEFAMNMENATHGIMSMKVICEEVAGGATPEEAFRTTFGTDKDSFYADFEAWKAENTR